MNAGPPPSADELLTERLTLAARRLPDVREMRTVLAEPASYRFTGGCPPSLDPLEERYRAQIA